MEYIKSLLAGNMYTLILGAITLVSLWFAWKNRGSVKEAIFDIIMKMPTGGSQQDRTPKPVLQRVAESIQKSDGQEGQHTE